MLPNSFSQGSHHVTLYFHRPHVRMSVSCNLANAVCCRNRELLSTWQVRSGCRPPNSYGRVYAFQTRRLAALSETQASRGWGTRRRLGLLCAPFSHHCEHNESIDHLGSHALQREPRFWTMTHSPEDNLLLSRCITTMWQLVIASSSWSPVTKCNFRQDSLCFCGWPPRLRWGPRHTQRWFCHVSGTQVTVQSPVEPNAHWSTHTLSTSLDVQQETKNVETPRRKFS